MFPFELLEESEAIIKSVKVNEDYILLTLEEIPGIFVWNFTSENIVRKIKSLTSPFSVWSVSVLHSQQLTVISPLLLLWEPVNGLPTNEIQISDYCLCGNKLSICVRGVSILTKNEIFDKLVIFQISVFFQMNNYTIYNILVQLPSVLDGCSMSYIQVVHKHVSGDTIVVPQTRMDDNFIVIASLNLLDLNHSIFQVRKTSSFELISTIYTGQEESPQFDFFNGLIASFLEEQRSIR